MHVVDRDTAATLALTSAGLLSANYGTLDVSVTNLVNNGRIGGADLDAHIVTANITGTGSFGVSGNSRLLFDHAVPAGMSVAFSSNTTGAKSELQLADPAGFGAAITFFN